MKTLAITGKFRPGFGQSRYAIVLLADDGPRRRFITCNRDSCSDFKINRFAQIEHAWTDFNERVNEAIRLHECPEPINHVTL